MAKKTTKKTSTKKVLKEKPYTDILETEFKDEEGNLKLKKTYMNKNKFVKEEIVNI